ncbi:hypothetical protein DOY81_007777 [Sarcophaga bullata]|nr:hypothetical protein DOY81_007777 [Sarcophaga bullata]
MNINARKPLHDYSNTPAYPDNDNSQEIQEDFNITEELPSNESDLSFCEEEDSTEYPLHSEHRKRYVFELSHSVPPASPRSRVRAATRSPSLLKCVPESKPVPEESSKTFSLVAIITIVILAFIVGVIYKYFLFNDKEKYCNYDDLQEQYPQQDQSLWRTLNVGINLIFNESTQSPAVYLFVHQGGQRVFKLVNDIARQSSKCFGPEVHPIELKKDDFIDTTEEGKKDYGHVIEKFKSKLKESNVFLIVNLNEIPAEAARALHTICDTHSPIAKNMVIFLTLTIPPDAKGTAVLKAENVLFEMWSPKLDRNELDPLITRVTDQVIPLQTF